MRGLRARPALPNFAVRRGDARAREGRAHARPVRRVFLVHKGGGGDVQQAGDGVGDAVRGDLEEAVVGALAQAKPLSNPGA